jgi:deoxyribose-phosphate aldolase
MTFPLYDDHRQNYDREKMKITENQLAQSIDQTNLNPNATETEITAFVINARRYNFYSTALLPIWVPIAAQILLGAQTTVVSAIGFPLGTSTTFSKVAETKWSLEQGPENIEIDMVMNISLLKSRRYDALEMDMREVVKAADGRTVKVIIEVPLLTPEEIVIASLIAENAGAGFIKTSTGFKPLKNWRPSTPEDVRLIKSAIGNRLKIKVAGGIATLSQALAVLEAGASRIGTSSGNAIVDAFREYNHIEEPGGDSMKRPTTKR